MHISRQMFHFQITKKKASQKPSYSNLKLSLEDMKSHCVQNGVTRISMPRFVSYSDTSPRDEY